VYTKLHIARLIVAFNRRICTYNLNGIYQERLKRLFAWGTKGVREMSYKIVSNSFIKIIISNRTWTDACKVCLLSFEKLNRGNQNVNKKLILPAAYSNGQCDKYCPLKSNIDLSVNVIRQSETTHKGQYSRNRAINAYSNFATMTDRNMACSAVSHTPCDRSTFNA